MKGIFAQQDAQLTEHSATIQTVQTEMHALRGEVQAYAGAASPAGMQELAASVTTLKANIEATWKSHEQALHFKDRGITYIVKEIRNMAAETRAAAAESGEPWKELAKYHRCAREWQQS